MKNAWKFIFIMFIAGCIVWILAVYAKEYAYRNVMLWWGLAIAAIISWVTAFTIGIKNVRWKR